MMSTEDNKATVRRWIEEGGNQGNVAVFDELSAPNWVYHDPNFPDAHTLADYKRSITEARSAFPDFHTTIEDLIAEGDKVVMRSTWRGTNTGDFVTPMPLPATGKQVTVMTITIVRFAGGKAVEVWSVGDSLGASRLPLRSRNGRRMRTIASQSGPFAVRFGHRFGFAHHRKARRRGPDVNVKGIVDHPHIWVKLFYNVE